MRHKEVIYLSGPDIAERKLYANEFSVNSKEYYTAISVGLRPSKIFEIYSFEYRGEVRLQHGDIVYDIIRAETKGEKTRMVCDWHTNV